MNTTVTEQIKQAISKHHGSVYDALNGTLADLDIANALLAKEREKSTALVEVLETIRAIIWIIDGPLPAPSRLKTVDKIACEALRIAGLT